MVINALTQYMTMGLGLNNLQSSGRCETTSFVQHCAIGRQVATSLTVVTMCFEGSEVSGKATPE